MLKLSRVGSAVESVTYEKVDRTSLLRSIPASTHNLSTLDNVLDNDQLKVDFTPLYQCIHIYTALDALDDIRKSYQADRKASDTVPLSAPFLMFLDRRNRT